MSHAEQDTRSRVSRRFAVEIEFLTESSTSTGCRDKKVTQADGLQCCIVFLWYGISVAPTSSYIFTEEHVGYSVASKPEYIQ